METAVKMHTTNIRTFFMALTTYDTNIKLFYTIPINAHSCIVEKELAVIYSAPRMDSVERLLFFAAGNEADKSELPGPFLSPSIGQNYCNDCQNGHAGQVDCCCQISVLHQVEKE